jgi:hypothetical protein
MIEGCIFVCVFYTIYGVQMKLAEKVKVLLLFGTRLLYVRLSSYLYYHTHQFAAVSLRE